MLKLKRELIEKREKKAFMEFRRQDVLSCETFLKELKKGETSIASIHFTGSVTERALIRRLCRYFGIDFKGSSRKECKITGFGKKYLIHYNIEY